MFKDIIWILDTVVYVKQLLLSSRVDDPCVVADDQHTPRCVWAVVLVLGSW